MIGDATLKLRSGRFKVGECIGYHKTFENARQFFTESDLSILIRSQNHMTVTNETCEQEV